MTPIIAHTAAIYPTSFAVIPGGNAPAPVPEPATMFLTASGLALGRPCAGGPVAAKLK